MSSDKIYLSKEEQLFLMAMLEINDPVEAAEKYALIIIEQQGDPTKLQEYLKKAMIAWDKRP